MSQFDVWQLCMQKCADLLKATSAVLTSSNESTLKEVAIADEAKNKLSGQLSVLVLESTKCSLCTWKLEI